MKAKIVSDLGLLGKGGCWPVLIALLLGTILLLSVLPAAALAAPAQGDSPTWAWVSGPVVPGAHQHGCCTYHLYLRRGWTGAVYTCNVAFRTMRAEQQGQLGWYSCAGRLGYW